MKLEGKVALITGGNRGIGAAIGKLFAAEGAKVVLVARRAELGDAVADGINAAGGEATFIAGDVTDEQTVDEIVKQTVASYGQLDIVVNSAGIAPAAPIEEMDPAVWDELMACNVRSMFLVSRASIPELRKTKGNIITLGSTFGVVGAGGSTGYALTKAAAISFAKSLALELAPDGIRVNALCPGATDTEFLHEWFDATGDAAGTQQWLVDRHPLGRLGTAEEQAKAALFLASDDASFVTGHALLVDGGYTAQ